MIRLTEHQPSLAGRSRILAWASVAAFVLALAWAAPPAGAQPPPDETGSWLPFITNASQGPYDWVDGPTHLRSDPQLANAMVGGQEGNIKLYVCRARFEESRREIKDIIDDLIKERGISLVNYGVHPGKYFDGHCNIGWGGKEVVLTSGYELLVNTRPQMAKYLPQNWVNHTEVPVSSPFGAFKGGYVGDTNMRVCQASYNNGFHPGKEWNGKCNIGWGGKEVAVDQYQVLVLKFSKFAWESYRKAQWYADIEKNKALSAGMVGRWSGEGNGSDSGGRNPSPINGSLQGGVSFAPGAVGQAFSFNGANGYVRVWAGQDIPFGTGPRTFMMWVYTRPSSWAPDQNTIFHLGGQGTSPNFKAGSTFGLDMDAYPNMQFYGWGNDILFNAHLPPEGWAHVAITYDGSVLRIYTNGVQRAERQMALNTAPTTLDIGGFVGSPAFGGLYFDGLIDEFMVFNRTLSASEIQAIHKADSMRMAQN